MTSLDRLLIANGGTLGADDWREFFKRGVWVEQPRVPIRFPKGIQYFLVTFQNKTYEGISTEYPHWHTVQEAVGRPDRCWTWNGILCLTIPLEWRQEEHKDIMYMICEFNKVEFL